MKSRIKFAFLLAMVAAPLWGQTGLKIGQPTSSTTATLTVTVTGAGTGSVSSSDGLIVNCTSAGGSNCIAIESIGSSPTLTPTATGGSSFAWSGCTGGVTAVGGGACSGTGALPITITANGSAVGVFSGSGSGAIQPTPFFCLDPNQASPYPPVAHGCARIWDTTGMTIPFLVSCSNGTNTCGPTGMAWNFTSTFDTFLAAAFTNGVHTTQMALARTPNFASGNTDLDVAGALTSGTFTNGETVIQTGGITSTVTSQAGGVLIIAQYSGTALTSNGVTWVGQTSGAVFTQTAGPARCNYFVNGSTQKQSLSGQCIAPSDVASNGTGANQYWRNMVAKVAGHANGIDGNAGYLTNHSYINAWECWNEPTQVKFWSLLYNTYAQEIRLCDDLYAIIKGYSTFALTFTSVNTTGVYQMGSNTLGSGNNLVGAHYNIAGFTNGANNNTNAVVTASTSTSVTFGALTTGTETHAGTGVFVNEFTGETDTAIQNTVTGITLSGPIDVNAKVMMPSYFANGTGYTQLPQYLYCQGQSAGTCGGIGGHLVTDAINIHIKEGNAITAYPATTMTASIAAVVAALSPADLLKALYDTEGGFSSTNWADCSPLRTSAPFCNYSDPDMMASYVGAVRAWDYFSGVVNYVWYNYSGANSGIGSTQANVATSNIYNWMVGQTGYTCTVTSHVYTCTGTAAAGYAVQIMWDATQDCIAGSCTTLPASVPVGMLHYYTITDATQTPISIVSHSVPLGIKPIFVVAH